VTGSRRLCALAISLLSGCVGLGLSRTEGCSDERSIPGPADLDAPCAVDGAPPDEGCAAPVVPQQSR
jgi:hypothetical protein